MRIVVLALLSIAVIGCTRKPVQQLGDWVGKNDAWVVAKLGPPESRIQLPQPIPDIGDLQTVQGKLNGLSPHYGGQIRILRWQEKDQHFRIVLIQRGERWVVLDALRWREGAFF